MGKKWTVNVVPDWLRRLGKWHRSVARRLAEGSRPLNVTVSFDRLELLLSDYMAAAARRGEALGWAGLLVGLTTALITGDFRYTEERLGLQGSEWRVLLMAACAFCGVSMIRAIWGAALSPTIPQFIDALAVDSGAVASERDIFLVKRQIPGRGIVILVYKSPSWECFFFPNSKPDGNLQSLADNLGFTLGLSPGSFQLAEHEGGSFISHKYSKFYEKDTTYRYRFFSVSGKPLPADMKGDFMRGGQTYAWKTIRELQGDEETLKRNGDVIKHISENSQRFLVDTNDIRFIS